MQLPLGYDDFAALKDNNLKFVDKSLLIKNILEDSAQVLVITRPRRFGKTLNLSMLHYFFAAEVYGNQTCELFDELYIAQHPEVMSHQGQYPVIALTFKDLKAENISDFYGSLARIISNLYEEHDAVLNRDKFYAHDIQEYDALLSRTATSLQLQNSLHFLSKCLYRQYGKKVILLLDEYDTPIQSGYIHHYYDEVIGPIRGLLSPMLKNNRYLHKAVLTGILRVSKESLFSGVNNLVVCSMLSDDYAEYFGFTEKEVEQLLIEAGLQEQSSQVKQWYNGYQIGNTVLYNPWSMVSCIRKQGLLQPYWVNTSDNMLAQRLLTQADLGIKEKIQNLMKGDPIDVAVDEHFVFADLERNESALWSLLLMTGYLKVIDQFVSPQGLLSCQVSIPNLEVKSLYARLITEWLSHDRGIRWYNEFLARLLAGDVAAFESDLQYMVEQIASVHDMAREPEAFYQGLLLGLTACLHAGDYRIQSNRESGHGRYDIAIIPRDPKKIGIIIELKQVPKKELHTGAQAALRQIEERHYIADLQQHGVAHVCKIGIAFNGKHLRAISQQS